MAKSKQYIKLTPKQEKYCQEYIKTGNKSEAYRHAYSTKNMKSETINNKAYKLMLKGEVRARVEQLQKEVAERNKITIDECVSILANMARFDLADLYDENGLLKSIHDIPVKTRQAIAEMSVFEEFAGTGKDRVFIGYTKKVKTADRKGAIVELMKHLGGYERDNKQKTASTVTVFKLPDNGRS